MAQNETDSGLFVALNYLSHLPLCLSEKIRRCFKSFDNFEKTSDFFRSLAGTDYHYCGLRRNDHLLREGLHKEWCPLRVLYGYGTFIIKGHESSLAKIATLYPRYKENSCYC